LKLSNNPSPDELQAVRVSYANNAWLRAVAYQILFQFQSLGLAFFTIGVYGFKWEWLSSPTSSSQFLIALFNLLLLLFTAIVPIIGPKDHFHINIQAKNGPEEFRNRPIFPLTKSLALVFAVNIIAYLIATVNLLLPALEYKLSLYPLLSFIPPKLGGILGALMGPLLLSAGGVIEGVVAESTFNQWFHFLAVIVLNIGMITVGLHFVDLVEFLSLK
jgi:hypothetical protein